MPAGIHLSLALMAMTDRKGRHLDVEMTSLEEDIEEELYVELPNRCRRLKDHIFRVQKARYGQVRAGPLQSKIFGAELKAKEFERSQADPFMF